MSDNENLKDAETVNDCVVKLQSIIDVVGKEAILQGLIGSECERSEDNKYSKQLAVMNLVNADFWLTIPCQVFPLQWFKMLRGYSKTLALAIDLMTKANNLGQVDKLDVSQLAKDHKIGAEKCFALLVNLAALGIISFRHPGSARMYVNVTLNVNPSNPQIDPGPGPEDVPEPPTESAATKPVPVSDEIEEIKQLRSAAASKIGSAVEDAINKEAA